MDLLFGFLEISVITCHNRSNINGYESKPYLYLLDFTFKWLVFTVQWLIPSCGKKQHDIAMATVTNPKPLNSVKIWLMTSKPQCVFFWSSTKIWGKEFMRFPRTSTTNILKAASKKRSWRVFLAPANGQWNTLAPKVRTPPSETWPAAANSGSYTGSKIGDDFKHIVIWSCS